MPKPRQSPSRRQLPPGWVSVSVGEVAELVNGYAFKSSDWRETGVPIIRIQNLNDPSATFNYFRGELPSKFKIHNGDLLFAWSGTPGTSFGTHIWKRGDAWLNQHIFKVVFDLRVLNRRYFQLALNRNLKKYIDELRLPTGIFYAQGVKANVLFFDRKPAQEKAWTQKLWIYDLRTNMHFTLKENPLKRSDLDEFVACYNPKNRHERKPTWSDHRSGGTGKNDKGRWRAYSYDELLKRDKVNLDIFWLKDEALEESANLPAPEVIAQEIADDLEAALEQFNTIAEDLKGS